MTLLLIVETCGNPDKYETAAPAPGFRAPVDDYPDASRKLRAHVETHRLGGGNVSRADITDGGRTVARVSFNGRVWPPEPWTAFSVPLYDPSRA